MSFETPLEGTQVHAIALHPNHKSILLRSAGAYGTVIAHEEQGVFTQVRLQSGEIRKVLQVKSYNMCMDCRSL